MGKASSMLQLSIFQKILLAMLFVAIVPLGVIWYIDYRNTAESTVNAIHQRLSSVSDQFVGQVNGWVTMNLKALNQIASLPDMASMNPARQLPFLKALVNEYTWSFVVHSTNLSGKNVARSDGRELLSYDDRIYFQDVVSGKPMGQQLAVAKATGKPSLQLAVPIHRAGPTQDSKSVAGVLTMAMHVTDLSEQVTRLHVGETGYAFLLDENGKVIAHPKPEYAAGTAGLADFSKHPAFTGRARAGKTEIVYDDNGRKVTAFVQPTQNGWTVVTQQDYEEAYAPVRAGNVRALLVLVVTLAAVVVIAWLLARGLANPIRNLTGFADDMSRGRLTGKMPETDRTDEIGALASAIDRMGASIRLAMDRLGAAKA